MYTSNMKKILLSFLFSLLILTNPLFGKSKDSHKKQTQREINNRKFASFVNDEIKNISVKKDQELNEFLNQMTLAEKVSQLFILNLEGKEKFYPVDKIERELVSYGEGKKVPYVPGGYLFFSYNLGDTPEEVKAFTQDIKNFCKDQHIIPPFLAVDEEGGYVQRLRKLAGKLPSQEDVSASMNVSEAYELYRDHAVKMAEMGFHMNLAPVVEILSEYNKDFLDGRSFGNAVQTDNYSIAEMNAYENNGIACVLKHFPGNTNTDPHSGLPEITLSKEDMDFALQPFCHAVSLKPSAVLMSHARTSIIDSDIPACFSYTWVTEKLRNEIGFDGIIFSDDIFMGALAKNGYPPEEACVKAIEAGIDVIMISEKRFINPAKVLMEKAESDSGFMNRINESCKRILKYKMDAGIWQSKIN